MLSKDRPYIILSTDTARVLGAGKDLSYLCHVLCIPGNFFPPLISESPKTFSTLKIFPC